MMQETQDLCESWIELGTDQSTMMQTVRIVENFATTSEKEYLADLEKDLKQPDPITDLQKEKKIADTLSRLVVLEDIADNANKCLTIFVSDKLRTIELVGSIADQLYEHFMTMPAAERKLSVQALKNLITSINFDIGTTKTREVKLASRLIESLIPRLIGGISKELIEETMELMGILLRRFGFLTHNHKDLRDVQLWQDYFCTGIELGAGSYARVFLGRHTKTAKAVAIKSLDWDRLSRFGSKQLTALENEIEIMRAADHPNIVRLFDVIKEGRMIHLVMEYCGGGTLSSYIAQKGALSEEEVRHFIRQLAMGLKFLRDKGIIHRDLKPDNLLLSTVQGTVTLKIADFTFARFAEPGDLITSMVGTPQFMAPEIFFERRYSEKADLWSVGAIIFMMLTGQHPYPVSSYDELFNRLERCTFQLPDSVSPDMKDLVHSLLQRNPDLRISWTEFFLHTCLNLNTLNQSVVITKLTESEQILIMDRELSDLKKEVDGYKASNKRLQSELGALEKKYREVQRREKQLELENAELAEKLTEKNNDSSSRDGAYWLDVVACQQKIAAEMEVKSKHWREAAEAKDIELRQLRLELEQAKAREADVHAREEVWTTREAEARAETQMVYAEIKELRTHTEHMVESSKFHKEEALRAKRMLEQVQQAHEGALKDKDEQIAKLQKELQEAVDELKAFQLWFEEEQNERGGGLLRNRKNGPA